MKKKRVHKMNDISEIDGAQEFTIIGTVRIHISYNGSIAQKQNDILNETNRLSGVSYRREKGHF